MTRMSKPATIADFPPGAPEEPGAGTAELQRVVAQFEASAEFLGSRYLERLKLRVESRSLKLWYETINKHAIVRENILAVARLVGDKTGIIPLLGHTGQ